MSNTEDTAPEQVDESTAAKPSDMPAKKAESETEQKPENSETDWKAEARKWESRAKANFEAIEKAQELEDALTETKKSLESANEQIASFQALEERRKWVSDVAREKGLPVDVVERISGDSYEEISEGAEIFSKSVARGAYVPKVADAPKHKRTTAEIFADHIGSRL